jgi:hypothetical protein
VGGGRASLNLPGACLCCKAVVMPSWASVKDLFR